MSLLTLLDMTSAFDTVDHDLLLCRLHVSYGIEGTVHKWLSSYLSNRHQTVRTLNSTSKSVAITCGVPQGSVLGPILFSLYTAELCDIVSSYNLVSRSLCG